MWRSYTKLSLYTQLTQVLIQQQQQQAASQQLPLSQGTDATRDNQLVTA